MRSISWTGCPGSSRNGSICGVTIRPGLIELARIPCARARRGEVPGHRQHAALGGAVRGLLDERRAAVRRHRRGVDDHPAAAGDQVRPGGLGDGEDQVELVVQGEPPVLPGHLLERPDPRRRGVVVEHVDPAGARRPHRPTRRPRRGRRGRRAPCSPSSRRRRGSRRRPPARARRRGHSRRRSRPRRRTAAPRPRPGRRRCP